MMAVVSVADHASRSRARGNLAAVALIALGLAGATLQAARAAECPNPDALGTSRELVVDPTEHPRIGTMQYAQTLPLKDHEVVLTFDDGPLPAHSNQVLEALASQCVKATFFIIGRMATAYPEGVRKLRDAGHTIGTHSENHPLSFNRMPVERAMQEINDGIAHTSAALGDPNAVAPFFRIPGLLRAEGVEQYLASRGLQTWSADFPADDWRHITSAQVLHLALTRLEAKGKGILLLHDIQARTAAMLPTLLRELKARGYHIVHVVPATPDRPATPTEPRDWLMHPGATASAGWPAVPHFAFIATAMTAAPDVTTAASAFAAPDFEAPRRGRIHLAGVVPLPPEAIWPRPATILPLAAAMLAAPDRSIFRFDGSVTRAPVIGHHVDLLSPHGSTVAAEPTEGETVVARRRLPGSSPVVPGGLQRARLAPG